MKKQFFVCLFAALTLGSVVTSCSDDDDSIVCPIETTTFNSSNGLELTYSGAPLLGKQVVFTPNAEDATKATLVLSGAVGDQSLPIALPALDVIPGEKATTLNVDLVINGDAVSFEGTDELNGRTIAYKGTASKSEMMLDLNVTLPTNAVQGKKIALYKDATGKNALAPIKLVWTIMAEDWQGNLVEQDATMLLNVALGMVKIDDLTLSQCLYGVLKEVSFLADGNVQAQYKDTPKSGDFVTSPLNLATYTSPKEGEIRLFLNVPQIINEATKDKSRAEEDKTPSGADLLPYLAEVMPQLIAMVPQLLTEGIQINYTVDENGVMFIYLDKEVLLPILKLFIPVLQNEEFLKTLSGVVEGTMPGFGGTVVALLKGIPVWLENTTKMQFGVQFIENK